MIFQLSLVKSKFLNVAAYFLILLLFSSCGSVEDLSRININRWYISHDLGLALKFHEIGKNIHGVYVQIDKAVAEEIPFQVKTRFGKVLFSFAGRDTERLKGKIEIGERGEIVIKPRWQREIIFYLEPKFPKPVLAPRYLKPIFNEVNREEVVYKVAQGYYSSKIVDKASRSEYIQIVLEVLKSLGQNLLMSDLQLTMDIYTPVGDTVQQRPLVVYIHGGAFIIGDKRDRFPSAVAEYLARCGFIVASINYRLGYIFLPGMYSNFERCIYRATQDVRGALQFMADNAAKYRISTDYFYTIGNSAGGILSLTNAFMENHQRWESTYSNVFLLQNDLGPLDSEEGERSKNYRLSGVISLWGGLTDLQIIDSHESTPVLLIHGNQDDIVPYEYDYPFRNVNPTVSSFFSRKIFGSYPIYQRIRQFGNPVTIHTLHGVGHEPQTNNDGTFNHLYDTILFKVNKFLTTTLKTKPLAIDGHSIVSAKHTKPKYSISSKESQSPIFWAVYGGIIIYSAPSFIEVVWLKSASNKRVEAMIIDNLGREVSGNLTVTQID